jgi:glycosyltransferase involved in cell wall biosynthesis
VNEIMPLVWQKRPDIRLHIVGSNAPDEVLKLASEQVIVHGYTTVEELQGLLSGCRMELVSLRYGGGVKGKVVEAMKNGLPVVTTSVGTQGLAGTEEFLMMGETAEELADQIVRHYDDTDLLKECSRKEVQYVRENFSEEQAMKVLEMDLDFD